MAGSTLQTRHSTTHSNSGFLQIISKIFMFRRMFSVCTTSNGVVDVAVEPRLKLSGELRQDAAANPTNDSFCCWIDAKF